LSVSSTPPILELLLIVFKIDGLDPLMMLPLIMMSKGGMAAEGASSLLPLLLLSGDGKPKPADIN